MNRRITIHCATLLASFLAAPWIARAVRWYVLEALGHGGDWEPICGVGTYLAWSVGAVVLSSVRAEFGWFKTGRYDF